MVPRPTRPIRTRHTTAFAQSSNIEYCRGPRGALATYTSKWCIDGNDERGCVLITHPSIIIQWPSQMKIHLRKTNQITLTVPYWTDFSQRMAENLASCPTRC